MNLFLNWLIWLIAPTVCVVILACILSLTPLKPPKQTSTSWFQKRDW